MVVKLKMQYSKQAIADLKNRISLADKALTRMDELKKELFQYTLAKRYKCKGCGWNHDVEKTMAQRHPRKFYTVKNAIMSELKVSGRTSCDTTIVAREAQIDSTIRDLATTYSEKAAQLNNWLFRQHHYYTKRNPADCIFDETWWADLDVYKKALTVIYSTVSKLSDMTRVELRYKSDTGSTSYKRDLDRDFLDAFDFSEAELADFKNSKLRELVASRLRTEHGDLVHDTAVLATNDEDSDYDDDDEPDEIDSADLTPTDYGYAVKQWSGNVLLVNLKTMKMKSIPVADYNMASGVNEVDLE